MATKSVDMLLLVFPLSLMCCLIAGVTNGTDALVMGRAGGSAILTMPTTTKFHHVGPVASNTIPRKHQFFLRTV